MRNTFTLLFRKVPSGKNVVYYYAYDGKHGRHGPWSTRLEKKTEARNYCIVLFREGKLIRKKENRPTFKEFVELFWDWEKSPYFKEQKKRSNLTQRYADKNRNVALNTLVPYFGKMRLNDITPDCIDDWLDKMIDDGYKSTTTNSYFGTMNLPTPRTQLDPQFGFLNTLLFLRRKLQWNQRFYSINHRFFPNSDKKWRFSVNIRAKNLEYLICFTILHLLESI